MLTITGKKDGFGSQYQSIMSGIAYASYKKYKYFHTPMSVVSHAQDSQTLNKFIGVRSDNNIKSTDRVNIKMPYVSEVHRSNKPSIFYNKSVISKIKSMYYSTPKPKQCPFDIAIHIRRGDVKNGMRYTDNKTYLKYIKMLISKYPTYTIGIYSEGNESDFRILKLPRVTFRLNLNLINTFHELVTAKILLMSKSSFSYSAAILSNGIVYYIPFWHKPLDHWKILR